MCAEASSPRFIWSTKEVRREQLRAAAGTSFPGLFSFVRFLETMPSETSAVTTLSTDSCDLVVYLHV